MTQTATDPSLSAETERLGHEDPDWLAAARREALARYDEAPLPDRVQHLWRYTDPASLLPGDRTPQTPGETFGDLPADCHDGTFAHVAGFGLAREGRILRAALGPEAIEAGVLLSDIREAAREQEELVRPRLFSLSHTDAEPGDKFEALSAALFQGGTFLHLPRGSTLAQPIFVANRVGGSGLLAGRSLVHAEESAQATIVFDLTSADAADAPLLHETTEIFVGANARLRVVYVQAFGRRVVHAPVVHCHLERDASLESVTVALGAGLTKSLLSAKLAGRGATTKVLGIVFGDGRQHFDHHTLQHHVVGYTDSNLDYRAVIADRARSAYTGNLRIGIDGVGSNAHQTNHNLLLSKTARADTIPELEILTNDVVASHAAAVGPIDEDLLYYCTSRGISREEARKLIVLGFLEPVVGRVPGEELQGRVRAALETRLAAVS